MSKFWAKEDDSSEDSSSSDDSSKSSSSSGSSVGGGGGAGGGGGRGKGETGGDNRWVMESDSGELIIFVHTSTFVTISLCCLRLNDVTVHTPTYTLLAQTRRNRSASSSRPKPVPSRHSNRPSRHYGWQCELMIIKS